MSNGNAPRVSIGVPVYNGEKFLRPTLDSLVSQTYRDIEIIISDNASTDGTALICEEYAARDSRVRYYRNDRNIGPAPNYNRTLDLARGDVFKLAGADDLLAPTFVQRCLRLLDEHSDTVVAYSLSKRIDESGNVFGEWPVELDLTGETPSARLASYVFTDHRSHNAAEGWGLIRTTAARRFRPFLGSFPSADRVLLVHLLLQGKIRRVDEPLFFDREHKARSGRALSVERIRPGSRLVKYLGAGPMPAYEWWDSTKKDRIVFPEWRWLAGYWQAVGLAQMSHVERAKCAVVLSALNVKFAPRLVRDVVIGFEQVINRTALATIGLDQRRATN